MKYFAYNPDGTFNGLWDSEFHNEDEIPSNKIEITKELHEYILSLNIIIKIKDLGALDLSKTYDVVDYDNIFVKQVIAALPVTPSAQDKLNAQFLKEEAELKKEVQEQKTLNAQVLKEIAKLKGGAV